MQIKDKVLDGVGKHFVAHGHGCYVLDACREVLVVKIKGKKIMVKIDGQVFCLNFALFLHLILIMYNDTSYCVVGKIQLSTM